MLALANLLAPGEDPTQDSDPRLTTLIEQLGLSPETMAELVEVSEQQTAAVKNIILG